MRRKRKASGMRPATQPPAELVDPDPAAWPSFDALLAAREDWLKDHRLPAELVVPWREARVQDRWPAGTRRGSRR